MTREEIIAAAEATLRLARHHAAVGGLEELSPAHLGDMLRQMRNPSFSMGKLNRWLGWMQAAVVAGSCGKVTLNDMKDINRPKGDQSSNPQHGAGIGDGVREALEAVIAKTRSLKIFKVQSGSFCAHPLVVDGDIDFVTATEAMRVAREINDELRAILAALSVSPDLSPGMAMEDRGGAIMLGRERVASLLELSDDEWTYLRLCYPDLIARARATLAATSSSDGIAPARPAPADGSQGEPAKDKHRRWQDFLTEVGKAQFALSAFKPSAWFRLGKYRRFYRDTPPTEGSAAGWIALYTAEAVAEALAAAEARADRAEEALKPFAAIADIFDHRSNLRPTTDDSPLMQWSDHRAGEATLTLGHLRSARAALRARTILKETPDAKA